MTLFDQSGASTNRLLHRLAEEPVLQEQRSFLESLWARYSPYADPNFQVEFRRDPVPRFWEMFLGCALEDAGFELVPRAQRPRSGPDLWVAAGDSRIWVEATAPTAGEGRDAVPSLMTSGWVPENDIVLRFRSALEDKYRLFREYRNAGIIAENEPYIVAMNGARIPNADIAFPGEIPYPIQAVLPLGLPSVTLDRTTLQVVDQGFERRSVIVKRSQAPVSTTVFLTPEYSDLSGILFANVGPLTSLRDLPAALALAHNPSATCRVPLRWIRGSSEWWVENGTLRARIVGGA